MVFDRFDPEVFLPDFEPENKSTSPAALQWIAKPMGSRIDLADKDALFAALDEEHRR